MKDIMISEKDREKEKLLEGIADTITPVEVARVLSLVDFD